MTRSTGPDGGDGSLKGMATLADALSAEKGTLRREEVQTIPVLEEVASWSKRRVLKGRVRVATRTETYEQQAEVTLDRNVVQVTRVPVERRIEVAPEVRTVGDTTIVPVVEERLVLVKQLFLVEEVHIRRHIEQETAHEAVSLRRQHATVERFDSDGRLILDGPARLR